MLLDIHVFVDSCIGIHYVSLVGTFTEFECALLLTRCCCAESNLVELVNFDKFLKSVTAPLKARPPAVGPRRPPKNRSNGERIVVVLKWAAVADTVLVLIGLEGMLY